jgi:uncharacterized membrane protein YkvA (DUF1232 family)
VDLKDLIDKVLASAFYSKSVNKASRLSQNSAGVFQLLKIVLEKVKKEGGNGLINKALAKVLLMVNLVKSYTAGQYKDIETKNIVFIIAGLIYLVMPIDFIPDFLPVLGFADDVALLIFIFNALNAEIERYELWQANKDLNR